MFPMLYVDAEEQNLPHSLNIPEAQTPRIHGLGGHETYIADPTPIQFGQVGAFYSTGQLTFPKLYGETQNVSFISDVGRQVFPSGYEPQDQVELRPGMMAQGVVNPEVFNPAAIGYAPLPPCVDSQQATRNQVVSTFQQLGFDVGRTSRIRYRGPYPEWIDRCHPYPHEYQVPEFTLFSGQDKVSSMEHVARFTIQCGEAADSSYLKMRLFANSLTQTAFDWYTHLPPRSLRTWDQMEQAFHNRFYRCEPEVTLADLASVKQGTTEPVGRFISRFKLMRHKCRVAIPERECIQILLKGMAFDLRRKLAAQTFLSISHLHTQARQAELNKQEEADTLTDVSSWSSDSSTDRTYGNVALAEMAFDKPFVCPTSLKAKEDKHHSSKHEGDKVMKGRKNYSFDVTRAEEIFDIMLKEEFIVLKGEYKIPAKKELDGKRYCKWHNSWSHDTNNCIVLRNQIEKAVSSGMLKFPEKKVKIKETPYLRLETRVADIKKIIGPKADSSHQRQVKPLKTVIQNPSQTSGIITRTCPHCLESYDEEDSDIGLRSRRKALGVNKKEHERKGEEFSNVDGTKKVTIAIKSKPPPLETCQLKSKPKPRGKHVQHEPKRERNINRGRLGKSKEVVVGLEQSNADIALQARKGRRDYRDELTRTQRRRLQRLRSLVRRNEEKSPSMNKHNGRTIRVWIPKNKQRPTAQAKEGKGWDAGLGAPLFQETADKEKIRSTVGMMTSGVIRHLGKLIK